MRPPKVYPHLDETELIEYFSSEPFRAGHACYLTVSIVKMNPNKLHLQNKFREDNATHVTVKILQHGHVLPVGHKMKRKKEKSYFLILKGDYISVI